MPWSKAEYHDLEELFSSYWKDFEKSDVFRTYSQKLDRFSATAVRNAASAIFARAETTYRPSLQTFTAELHHAQEREASPRERWIQHLERESRYGARAVCPRDGQLATVAPGGLSHARDDRPGHACLYSAMEDDQLRELVNHLQYRRDKATRERLMGFEEFRARTLAGEDTGVSVETMRGFLNRSSLVADVDFDFGANREAQRNS